MISKISFTGKENLLTKNLKNTVERYEYIGADKVYSKAERLIAEKQGKTTNSYFSPFANITDTSEVNGNENIGLIYAKAHGKNIDYKA